MEEETQKDEISKYTLFHAQRIFNVCLDVQTPSNDQDNGKSTTGNFLLKTNKDKVTRILSSMYELGLLSYDERNLMETSFIIEHKKHEEKQP